MTSLTLLRKPVGLAIEYAVCQRNDLVEIRLTFSGCCGLCRNMKP